MKYFWIAQGLRGCDLPDNGFCVEAESKERLHACVAWECRYAKEAYGYGGTKRELAWAVNFIWNNPHYGQLVTIGFGRSRLRKDRPFGVFISQATENEFREANKEYA